MRALPAVLFLSLSGLAARAQEGMMAPPADAGQGGTMMMSAPASRIVPFSDLSTARLLAYGVPDRHTWVRIDAAGGKLAVWNGGGMDELLAGSGNESVAPGGARQAKAIRRRRSI